jgi:hypothetical protein
VTETETETQGQQCERCQQVRPVARYQVQHTHLFEPDSFSCRWCTRFPDPMLCAGCTAVEEAEERAGVPRSAGEQRGVGFLLRGAELDERRRAS